MGEYSPTSLETHENKAKARCWREGSVGLQDFKDQSIIIAENSMNSPAASILGPLDSKILYIIPFIFLQGSVRRVSWHKGWDR